MIINGNYLLRAEPIVDMETVKRRYEGTSYGLSEAGYDIRIKQEVIFYPGRIIHAGMCVSAGEEPWQIGRFTLASAMEEFQMPNDLVGTVKDKSTWARQGLSVFNTVIEPGWKRFLTLELVYHGSKPLYIKAGQGIAQVLFSEIAEKNAYAGKYQNQEDKPVAARS